DTDPAFKGADSGVLLQKVWEFVREQGYELGNIDCTIIAQKPKMAPNIESMRKRISELLETSIDNIKVKATKTEKLGFKGREEGI
ncbi:2-C-methyl-D-erythritol 2,4-cyclodiphosphate synthase, partial [Bacillus thuringiensis]